MKARQSGWRLVRRAALLWMLSASGWAQVAFDANRMAADDTLAITRGGFQGTDGLTASFGLDRSVSINGAVVSSATVNIRDVRNITASQAAELRSALSSAVLIQNGPGNAVSGLGGQPSGATIIQNSLNDQSIKSLTVLNVSSNGLQFFKAMNTLSALNDALVPPARR